MFSECNVFESMINSVEFPCNLNYLNASNAFVGFPSSPQALSA